MSLAEEQAERVDAILPWARTLGALRSVWRPHEQQLHLRPSATGIRLVDLHPQRPQFDRGKIGKHEDAAATFAKLLETAQTKAPGRPTPEKRLQSFLLLDAYKNDGFLRTLSKELVVVTDEQRFPGKDNDAVCDLLAVRGSAPVVIELKSARQMARLVEQVNATAAVVDAHRERFASLFSEILGKTIVLDRRCERWLVWPAAPGEDHDPRAPELGRQGICVVSYVEGKAGFRFTVAPPAAMRL